MLSNHAGRTGSSWWGSVFLSLAVAAGALGCGHDEPIGGAGARPGPGQSSQQGQPGATIAVEGRRLESGFARGYLRKATEVESFRISKHPIALGEYRACISAGGCEQPHEGACTDWPTNPVMRRPNLKLEGVADDVPVTCVGLEGARRYCTWVGGTLPTLEQWQLAARGPTPQRHAWGSSLATCKQHPLAVTEDGKRCAEPEADVGRIGRHAAGASAAGLEDVLLTGGELLGASADALFPACRAEESGKSSGGSRTDSACLVYGVSPGAIDSVRKIERAERQPDGTAIPYGFRCVWGGAS
jgi:formylglycine-generating enzyme required for sulfatase activity